MQPVSRSTRFSLGNWREVLLFGFRARTPDGRDFKIVGDYLSYEPYGITYRKDDPLFATVVERAFSQLISSRAILEVYGRWFMHTIPPGIRMQMPMSPRLRYVFDSLGLPDEAHDD
jgi:hypothetical protein